MSDEWVDNVIKSLPPTRRATLLDICRALIRAERANAGHRAWRMRQERRRADERTATAREVIEALRQQTLRELKTHGTPDVNIDFAD